MSNINLNLTTESGNQNKSGIFSGSLIFSIAILALVLCLYGVLLFYNKKLGSDISNVQAEYIVENDKFQAGNAKQVMDFSNRSKVAGKFLADDQSAVEIISELEKSMLPAVHLSSLKYDKKTKTVALACVGDNFNTVAKQVLNFKQNEYFSVVVPGVSAVDPTDSKKLNFEIDLTIKIK